MIRLPEMTIDLILLKDILGYTSTVLLTALYVPQVWHVYRSRDAYGLSLTFILLGILLTIDSAIYGALLGEWPLIIANVTVFICLVLMLIARCIWPKPKSNNNGVGMSVSV